jgi:hypothetical protein
MFCQAGFDQWRTIIMQHLPHLSKPQATVLALWSFGMVLAHSCALSAVSHFLAKGMQRKEQTVRQQLRAWYDDAPRKRGAKRQELRVETCFPLLLGWVVSWWQDTQLALAIDATALCPRHPRTRRATRLRLVSVFRQGWVALLVALLRQEPLPQGRFVPEPWPAVPAWEEEAPESQLALPEAA